MAVASAMVVLLVIFGMIYTISPTVAVAVAIGMILWWLVMGVLKVLARAADDARRE